MIRPFRVALLAGVALLVAAPAFAQNEQAEAYFKKIIEANQSLKQAGFNAGREFGPLLADQEPNAAKLKAAVQAAQQEYTQVAKGMQQATPPESAEGRALAAAHTKFMEGQQKIITQDFVAMMNSAIDQNKPIAQRKAELQKGLEAVSKLEQESLPPLVEAFVAYAQKYNIQVQ